VSPLKHPTRPFNIGALNSSSRQKHYPPLKPTISLPLKRAATNPYVAFDQIYQNFILIVPPHNVLDETYLALELEHDVLDSLSSTSCPSELTTVFQSIAIQIFLTWIQIYHVIWEHKA
jgi:hypothetical protein